MRQAKRPELNWYQRMGVKAPVQNEHLTEEELQKRFEELRASTVHGMWSQMGNVITCQRCNPQHAAPIPVDYLLMGTDDKGLPILKKL